MHIFLVPPWIYASDENLLYATDPGAIQHEDSAGDRWDRGAIQHNEA